MFIYQADWKRIDVEIKWDKPIPIAYAKALENDTDTYLYKIVGVHNGNLWIVPKRLI